MALTFYGKKSCITCKKAKAFLEAQHIAFEECPIETQPPAPAVLEQLVDENDLKASLNTRSAIYKANDLGKSLPGKDQILKLMQEDPNLIKRPVIMGNNGALYQGFDEESLQAFIKANA